MDTMTLSRSGARRGLMMLGLVSLVIGFSAMAYAGLILRPKLVAVMDQTRSTLGVASDTVRVLGRDSRLADSGMQLAEHGGEMIAVMPEALNGLRKVLHQGSRASHATGETAEETKKGVAGVVLPKEEMEKNTAELHRTARQMQSLASVLDGLQAPSIALARSARVLSRDLSTIRPQFSGDNGLLVRADNDLRATSAALADVDLPDHLFLGACLLGGIYVVFGVAALGCALAIPAAASDRSFLASAVHA